MSDELENSFQILKQTVPLLLKHKIPAIPTNYALWYTYNANQKPALNEELNAMTETGRPLSKVHAKELYRKHLADEEEFTSWQLRQSLEAMLIELSQSVTDTKNNTQGFKQSMDACMDDLGKVEKEGWTMDEVMQLVRTMVKETQHIRRSTLDFSAALNSAEKEIAELRQQLAETQQDAFYDALTELYNRRYLDEEIRTMKAENQVCLIMIDADHFKDINDNYGHQMGDRVLKAIAKQLKQKCQPNAIPYRFGGEEFAVMMTGATLKDALRQAEALRRALEKITVIDRRSNTSISDITASFGVAEFGADMRRSDLLEQADKQLYEAKRLGRNRVMPIPG